MAILELQEDKLMIPLHYEVTGPEDGIPIVMIHGWLCDMTYWEEILPLSQSGYKIIRLDLRGHGETPLMGKFSIETLADDVYQLVQALHLSRTIMIGHSMGGLITQAFYNAHPEMIIALGLWNTGARMPLGYGEILYPMTLTSFMLLLILFCWWRGLFNFILTTGWQMGWKKKSKDLVYKQKIIAMRKLLPKTVLKVPVALSGYDNRKKLGNITVPVMLLHGKADKIISPVVLINYLEKHLLKPMRFDVEDAAHFAPNEQPEEVLGYLRKFLESIKSP